MDRVARLPDFRAWKSGHTFPVAFDIGPHTQESIEGKCYWEVPVYADRPERFEHWETFYVAANSRNIYVFDAALGEPVTLSAWRKGQTP